MKKLFFAFALFATACVSSKSDDTAASEPSASEPSTSEPADTQSEPSQSEPSASTDCTDAGTFQECAQCFAAENPAGAQAYDSIVIAECYCGTECGTDCADFCSTSDINALTAECDTCFQGVAQDRNSACISGFQTECSANADCVAFATDLQACPQN